MTSKLTKAWARKRQTDDERILNHNLIRVDRPTVATAGLWLALAKQDGRQFGDWSVESKFGLFDDKIIFSGVERLSSFDLTVFMCVVSIAVEYRAGASKLGQPTKASVDHTSTSLRARLRASVIPAGDGAHIPATSIAYFTKYLLTKMATGADGKKEYARVEASLDKMMRTTVKFESQDKTMTYQSPLIGGKITVHDNVAVTLNPLVSGAIMVESRQFIKMELEQLLALPHGAAKIIYKHLSSRVYQGNFETFKQDDLVEHAFGVAPDGLSRSTLQKRRKSVEDAMLNHIGYLRGWDVSKDGKGRYVVDRQGKRQKIRA